MLCEKLFFLLILSLLQFFFFLVCLFSSFKDLCFKPKSSKDFVFSSDTKLLAPDWVNCELWSVRRKNFQQKLIRKHLALSASPGDDLNTIKLAVSDFEQQGLSLSSVNPRIHTVSPFGRSTERKGCVWASRPRESQPWERASRPRFCRRGRCHAGRHACLPECRGWTLPLQGPLGLRGASAASPQCRRAPPLLLLPLCPCDVRTWVPSYFSDTRH